MEVPVAGLDQVTAPVGVPAEEEEEEAAVVVVAVVEGAAIETESKLERHSLCIWNPYCAPFGQFLLADPTHQ